MPKVSVDYRYNANIYDFSRGELAPLKVNEERLAKLAQVIMLKDPKQIRAAAGWQGINYAHKLRVICYHSFRQRQIIQTAIDG